MKNTSSTKWGLILALVVAISFLHFGCKSINKATQQVLTDSTAFTNVGNEYLRLHPCKTVTTGHSTDTTVTSGTTESDYTTSVSKIDTGGVYIHDTVTVTIHDKVTIHDTVRIHIKDTVIDGQQVAILKSTIEQRNLQISTINGAITSSNLATQVASGEAGEWKFKFWILLFLFFAFCFLGIFLWVKSGEIKNVADEIISKV